MIAEKTGYPSRSLSLPNERAPHQSPHLCDVNAVSFAPAFVTLQGAASTSYKSSRPKPSLDENRSPFSRNLDLIPRLPSDRSSEMSRNSPVSPWLPQSTPGTGRRPKSQGTVKLPPIGDSMAKPTKLPIVPSRREHYEEELPIERGCMTAPASGYPATGHSRSFFPHAPTPPLTASPAGSGRSPKGKHIHSRHRKRSSGLVVRDPKEFPSSSGYTPGAISSKSAHSHTTASTTDVPDLHLPPSSPIMDTPAATCSMVSARAECDAPISTRNSNRTPSSDTIAPGIVRWKKGEQIGVGQQGCVYKALNLSNGHLFVVKESKTSTKEYREKLKVELNICKDLVHPNIVRCLGHEYVQQSIENCLYIQLEYIPGGSLKSMLSEFGPLELGLLPQAMRQLVAGLQYLHSRSPPVVHRDIKSANVLVGQDFCLKLADFGCSKKDDLTTSFSTLGTALWMAPEVIRGTGGHGRKADIWSLGCVFIEMVTAEKPWGNAFKDVLPAMRHIEASDESPPIPGTLPDAAYDMIAQCVRRDPHDRPKASDLLAHEFIRRARG